MKRSLKPIVPRTLSSQILYAYVVTVEEVSQMITAVATSTPLWGAIGVVAGSKWLGQLLG